jgi:hypothetical protein
VTADVVGTLARFNDQAGSSNGGCAAVAGVSSGCHMRLL